MGCWVEGACLDTACTGCGETCHALPIPVSITHASIQGQKDSRNSLSHALLGFPCHRTGNLPLSASLPHSCLPDQPFGRQLQTGCVQKFCSIPQAVLAVGPFTLLLVPKAGQRHGQSPIHVSAEGHLHGRRCWLLQRDTAQLRGQTFIPEPLNLQGPHRWSGLAFFRREHGGGWASVTSPSRRFCQTRREMEHGDALTGAHSARPQPTVLSKATPGTLTSPTAACSRPRSGVARWEALGAWSCEQVLGDSAAPPSRRWQAEEGCEKMIWQRMRAAQMGCSRADWLPWHPRRHALRAMPGQAAKAPKLDGCCQLFTRALQILFGWPAFVAAVCSWLGGGAPS